MTKEAAKVPEIISIALQDAGVAALHAKVATHHPIAYEPSSDERWGNTTTPVGTMINYVSCAHPRDALAHELCHAQIKIGGYRQYSLAVAKRPCAKPHQIKPILEMLDNELQHHRIWKHFIEIGGDIRNFYCDADAHAFDDVRATLQLMSDKNTRAEFLGQYLTAIAPGGTQSDGERAALKSEIKQRAGANIAASLSEIETIFVEWADVASLESGPTLKAILEALKLECSFWIGASQEFPQDGFFVGQEFGLAEAQGV